MTAYRVLLDNEWVDLPAGLMKVACCDCGLVHVVQVQTRGRKGGYRFRAVRDPKATKSHRKTSRKGALPS